ncbi:MAG: hypothetical protein V4733_10930 [Verrucomicrobiota bacterium]
MKLSHPLPAFLTGVLLAGVAGYWLGISNNDSARLARDDSGGPGRDRSRDPAPASFDDREFRSRLDAETDPLKRQKIALSGMEDWGNKDPKGALTWLNSQPPSGRRNEIITLALQQFAGTDPQGAIEWAVNNLKGRDLHNEFIMLADSWAEHDPAAAAKWVGAQSATDARDAALEGLLFTWGSTEPKAALDFIANFKGDAQALSILRTAAYAGWAKSDPVAAATGSMEASRNLGEPRMFGVTMANWATVDLAASSTWLLNEAPVGAERSTAFNRLAKVFAQQAPDAGIEWLAKIPDADRPAAATAFAADWASVDPAASANWAAKQPAELLGKKAITAIVFNYMNANQDSFDAWRASLPPGPLKTAADSTAPSPAAPGESGR